MKIGLASPKRHPGGFERGQVEGSNLSFRGRRRLGLLLLATAITAAAAEHRHDVVIYGGTAGGVVSAITAAQEGATIIVLEPTQHIGGMVTGGLGSTDIG